MGTFSNASVGLVSVLQCSQCSSGTFGAATGLTAGEQCSSCSIGKFSTRLAITSDAQCALCSPGKRGKTDQGLSRDSETAACAECAAGKYSSGAGSMSCDSCASGSIANLNRSACTPCAAGKTYDEADKSCTDCPAGRYWREFAATCTLCNSGRYGSRTGETSSDCEGSCPGVPYGSKCCPQIAGSCKGIQQATPSSSFVPSPTPSFSSSTMTTPSPTPSVSSLTTKSSPFPTLLVLSLSFFFIFAVIGAVYYHYSTREQRASSAVQAEVELTEGKDNAEKSRDGGDDKDESATAVGGATSEARDATLTFAEAHQAIGPNSAVIPRGNVEQYHHQQKQEAHQQWAEQQQQWEQSRKPNVQLEMAQQQSTSQQSQKNISSFATSIPFPGMSAGGQGKASATTMQGTQQINSNGFRQPQYQKCYQQKQSGSISWRNQALSSNGSTGMQQTTTSGTNFVPGVYGMPPYQASYQQQLSGPTVWRNGAFGSSVNTEMQNMPTSGANFVPGGHGTQSNLYHTCQAQISLWHQIEIKGARIEKFDRLGQGAYAEVHRGRVNNIECAIKIYRNTATQEQRQAAMREIEIAASLNHPCTLRIMGWTRSPLQTMTELCLGDLKAFYNDKIDELLYCELEALRLLKVGFCIAR